MKLDKNTPGAGLLKVFLNGQEVGNCCEIDLDKNTVVIEPADVKGNPFIDWANERIHTATLVGKITLEYRGDDPPPDIKAAIEMTR